MIFKRAKGGTFALPKPSNPEKNSGYYKDYNALETRKRTQHINDQRSSVRS